jgi:GGDEF domain-containing protein
VSASVGVAIFPDDGTTETSLYKAADVALYESKRTGSSFSCRKLTKPPRAMANVFPARHGLEGSGTEG